MDRWRELPGFERVVRDAGGRAAPEALAQLSVRRHPALILPVEAVETAIWLTALPILGQEGRRFHDQSDAASQGANQGLARLALKLAAGAGKTTVMAMIIAWQTINSTPRPGTRRFTRGFLVVTPGVTIRDRPRGLQSTIRTAATRAAREYCYDDYAMLAKFIGTDLMRSCGAVVI